MRDGLNAREGVERRSKCRPGPGYWLLLPLRQLLLLHLQMLQLCVGLLHQLLLKHGGQEHIGLGQGILSVLLRGSRSVGRRIVGDGRDHKSFGESPVCRCRQRLSLVRLAVILPIIALRMQLLSQCSAFGFGTVSRLP